MTGVWGLRCKGVCGVVFLVLRGKCSQLVILEQEGVGLRKRVRVEGLGFRVEGLGFRVQGLGFRVQSLPSLGPCGDFYFPSFACRRPFGFHVWSLLLWRSFQGVARAVKQQFPAKWCWSVGFGFSFP